MTSSRKTWISIAVASVIIVGMLALAVVGGTALFIYRHVDSEITGPENAEQQFTRMRAKFAGQQPLVEMRTNDEPMLHRTSSAPRQELRALHALAYDARAHKLVRVDVPIWLLRLMPSGNAIHISDVDELDDQHARLTLEDLERHGPGLVLDVRRRRDAHVLVWTE
jgi:hypothetical protein